MRKETIEQILWRMFSKAHYLRERYPKDMFLFGRADAFYEIIQELDRQRLIGAEVMSAVERKIV